jgi:hypothetical protein
MVLTVSFALSNVRDDRETPLCVGRDGGNYEVDLVKSRSRIFLPKGRDRPITDLPVGQIFARNGRSRQRPMGSKRAVAWLVTKHPLRTSGAQ